MACKFEGFYLFPHLIPLFWHLNSCPYQWVIKHWNRLSMEVVESPPLEIVKTGTCKTETCEEGLKIYLMCNWRVKTATSLWKKAATNHNLLSRVIPLPTLSSLPVHVLLEEMRITSISHKGQSPGNSQKKERLSKVSLAISGKHCILKMTDFKSPSNTQQFSKTEERPSCGVLKNHQIPHLSTAKASGVGLGSSPRESHQK